MDNINESPAERRDEPVAAYAVDEQELERVLSKFNWGAFLMAPLWALNYRRWLLGIIMIICNITVILSPLTIILGIIQGFGGNRIAWRVYGEKFGTVEVMMKSQKAWAIWGFILTAITILLSILSFAGQASSSYSYY